ncbi:PREDICTED: cytochrome P450 6k1-like [Nicrophorus vespilloides]|uniref:Cytochrome P450 6k1-like n=1 Tax=Nicrophorus vespilloides TaxID=110193 RepID=A0ABM1MXP8_NICVS|nr:PREDICTED: cytochrome P450 6k1-like [Nicrophorus vespilloides]
MFFIIILGFVLVLIYLYITQNFDYWKKRGISYLEPCFPFGNIFPLVIFKKSYTDLMAQFYNSSNEPVVGYWIFNIPFLMIRSPELIKNIFVRDFHHFNERVSSVINIDPFIKKTLFSLNYHDWKILRSKLSPSFTTSKLKNVMHIFNQSSNEMIEYLDEVSGESVDCKLISSQLTANVFAGSVFGYKINCFKDVDNEFFVYSQQLLAPTLANFVRLAGFFVMPEIATFLKINLFRKGDLDFYRHHFWKAVNAREESGLKNNDLIDCYVQLKNEGDLGDGFTFDEDSLSAQAIQFFLSGYETTSSLISFALYELAMNEDIQENLRHEIVDGLAAEEDGKFSYENIMELSYLNKVISESLRKYPTLPLIDRQCVKDYQIPGTKIIIEEGTRCQFSPLGLHYDPEFFPNPDIFDPERFSTENVKTRPSYVYMPFGHGPHNCIGKLFGLLIAKNSIVQILTNFQILPTECTPKRIEIDNKMFLFKPKDVFLKFVKL